MEELKGYLKKRGLHTDLQKMMEKYDKNSDGIVTFEEFCKYEINRLGTAVALLGAE